MAMSLPGFRVLRLMLPSNSACLCCRPAAGRSGRAKRTRHRDTIVPLEVMDGHTTILVGQVFTRSRSTATLKVSPLPPRPVLGGTMPLCKEDDPPIRLS